MAYNQKNNPFKKLSSSPVTARKSPFFSHETPVETESKTRDHASIVQWLEGLEKDKDIRELRRERRSEAVETLGNIRVALGDERGAKGGKDNFQNKHSIRTLNKESTGNAIDKLMAMPSEDINTLTSDIMGVIEPFKGITELTPTALARIYDLDLTKFKKYFKKADISVEELGEIITNKLDSMPDKDNDGTADYWQGFGGRLQRAGVNKVITAKLKALK